VDVYRGKREDNQGGAFYVLPPDKPFQDYQSWFIFQPTDRHNIGANLTFADGGARYEKWLWPKLMILDTPNEMQLATSADLRDLRWLQARLPPPQP